MRLSTLVERVEKVARLHSFIATGVKGYLNEAVLDAASQVLLPDLQSSENVRTHTNSYKVDMPDEYHRNLYFVSSDATDLEIKIFRTKTALLRDHPRLETTGDVEAVCVSEKALHYNPIPSTADTLTLHYYRQPVEMTADTDEPDGIPAHLQDKLLVNYALAKVFEPFEDNPLAAKLKSKHEGAYYSALVDTKTFVGDTDEGGPAYVRDLSDEFIS